MPSPPEPPAPDDDEKLEVNYPTSWGYRIIGEDEQALRAAAKHILRDMDYQILAGHESGKGSYVSLQIRAVHTGPAQRKKGTAYQKTFQIIAMGR